MASRKKPRAGGQRKRVGRPAGPPENVRRNRVIAQLTDAEFKKLHRLAEKRDLPVGTLVYEILARSLKRRK